MRIVGDYICDWRTFTLWSHGKAFLIKVAIEKNNGSFCLLLPKVPLVTVAVPVFPSPPPCCARSSPQEPLLGLGLWRLQEAIYQEPGTFPHRLKSESFWRPQQRRYEVLSWIIHDETIIRPQFENGPKASLLFSDQEYEGRLTKLRSYQILVY